MFLVVRSNYSDRTFGLLPPKGKRTTRSCPGELPRHRSESEVSIEVDHSDQTRRRGVYMTNEGKSEVRVCKSPSKSTF